MSDPSPSSSSSSSSSSSGAPSFPAEREKFDEYRLKMEAYLQAQDLITTIIQPSKVVIDKKKMKLSDYHAWLIKNEETCIKAKLLVQSATTAATIANAHKEIDVIHMFEL